MTDVAITLRKQNEYLEGITWGQAIFLQLAKRTWLRPGVTANFVALDGAGRVMITKVTKGTIQKPTKLCEDGNMNKAQGSLIEVTLDRFVSGEFHGCFVVAGIVPLTWRKAIDKGTVMMMGMSFQTDVETTLVETATEATTERGDQTPAKYLLKLKSEFFNKSARQATAALVSSSFYGELIDQHTNLATAGSDYAFINGSVGRVSGLEIIETDMEADAILVTEDAINIPLMSSSKDIPSLAGTNLTVDLGAFAPSVSGGFISKLDPNPKGIAAYTYVHFPYGIEIIPELALKTKTAADTPSKAPKSASK